MSNSFFQFKKFTVYHDKCAMKVGTDGVLLGAWAPVAEARRLLDVGTGTGLIALQLAQRNPQAEITAIEMDAAAAEQAKDNILHSPWADRIEIVCIDFRNFRSEDKFDLIVSNPPYFVDALKCPGEQRRMARHAESLSYASLFCHSSRLLNEEGALSLIIPSEFEKTAIDEAWNRKLFPSHRTRIFTKPGKPCRRMLLTFGFQEKKCIEESLCIEVNHNEFTPEYIALTKDFYLNM